MGAIFLSYAREDRPLAETLVRALEGAGHDLWWDRHIDSGEEFSAEIEAALDRADVVLVVWSKISGKSRWVRDEAAVGGDTGRLVPVSIDGTLPPMGFRQFHTLDLTGWKGGKRDQRTAELLHAVERKLRSNDKAAAPALAPPPKQRIRVGKSARMWAVAAGLLLLMAGAIALVITRGRPDAANATRTIAVLPFTATSADATLRDLAAQTRDAVVHSLSDSGVPVKLINADGSGDAKIPADYFIVAELSGDPKKVTATVRMEDAAQRITVWSRQIDADRQDLSVLPERVGAQVAGTLSWSGTMRNLDPSDPNLTAKLLQTDITREPLQNYLNAQRLALQWPNSGMAQLSLAMYTAFGLYDLPREQRAQAVATARQAGDRARSLVPHFGDAYVPWCVLHPSVLMAKCEDQLRAGLKADPDAPFVNQFLSYQLNGVGRTQEAFDRASLSYQHDPYMPAKISNMVRLLEIVGSGGDADSLYLQGIRWWPDWGFFRSRVMGILERGDFDALRHVELEPGAGHYGKPFPDSVALVAALKARSLPQLKRTCAGAAEYFYALPCMLAFAKLGDLDSAYALADQLYPRQLGRTPAESEQLWLENAGGSPLELIASAAATPMRRDPRFLQLAERTGLLAYWRAGRPPDFCRPPRPEPVCAQLLSRGRK